MQPLTLHMNIGPAMSFAIMAGVLKILDLFHIADVHRDGKDPVAKKVCYEALCVSVRLNAISPYKCK